MMTAFFGYLPKWLGFLYPETVGQDHGRAPRRSRCHAYNFRLPVNRTSPMKPEVDISSAVSLDEKSFAHKLEPHYQLTVIVFAALIFLGFLFGAPSLMDDVDSAHAAIGRTMLESGDWVTPRLDGVIYLDKSPFGYWAIAASYAVFGVHDWAARIPFALSAILLCWVTARFGAWAFGRRAGFYAGLALATCVGLFLFTRILIPDVMLTLSVTISLWCFLRVLQADETPSRLWTVVMAVSLGAGLLIKSLIAVVAPAGAALLYLLLTRQMFSRETWRRLRPFSTALIALLLPTSWYVLAILHNPPHFDFTLHSGPGQFRGFFWEYFINEQVLRFLNLRYPRDYNTVPRLEFWLLQLAWLFPWSVYIPAVARLRFKPTDRAGRARLLALCWIGFVLLFFTLSTTQEYYSMPIYPALALLIGSAMAEGGGWVRWGTRMAAAIATAGAVSAAVLLWLVRNVPAPGDIASALTQHPDAYTLSLGHMQDLTLESFAYFRLPLVLAAVAMLVGALGSWRYEWLRGSSAVVGPAQKFVPAGAFLALALMMVLLTQAARMAMVVMEPVLSSQALAEALRKAPPGELIVGDEYYSFSSVFFYAHRIGFLLNGRVNNLEYGSYAPGAPAVFIGDSELKTLWKRPQRCYLLAAATAVPRLRALVGPYSMYSVKESGGKFLFSNHPIDGAE